MNHNYERWKHQTAAILAWGLLFAVFVIAGVVLP